ncbi:HEAT repeat domain-containing protein [Anatilimnocola floriformis]|uniref:HEAT repeat domain-containing protein n=1 Tax=Anatilimnocola floriformis TaxID=2948575 RepID=UPI0020C40C9B|nr:HEAT repeat domain-containing protein [Anatilimnocola floriformis]
MKTFSLCALLLTALLAGCTTEQASTPPITETPKPASVDPETPLQRSPIERPDQIEKVPVEPAPADPTPVDPPAKVPENNPPTPTPPKPVVNVDDLVKQLATTERQAAAVSLATAGKLAVPALVKALDDKDWQVRAAAVFALGQIGKDAMDAKTRLQTIAEKDENASVRDAAAFALDAISEG